MNSLNILMFAPAYPDKHDRTKQNHIHNSIRTYKNFGMNILVVDLFPARPGITREDFEGVSVLRFGVLPHGLLRSFLFRLVFQKRLNAFLKSEIGRFDIVHINNALVQLLPSLPILSRKPIVATCHGDDVYPSNNVRLEQKRKALLRSCQHITAVSANTARLIKGYVSEDVAVRIIFNGIRTDIYSSVFNISKENLRQKYFIPKNAFVILMACSLIERKGVREVMEAFFMARKSHDRLFLIVVGRGELAGQLSEMVANNNMREAVRFIPYVDSDIDMAEYYRLSDLYIMLSKTVPNAHGAGIEGFGISYIDAGAVGIPAIGGDSGGVRDAVVDGVTGMLVDPARSDLVNKTAELIEKFASDSELCKRMGHAARDRVWSKFTWEEYNAQMRSMYETVLRSK